MTNLRFQSYDIRLTKKKRYSALMKIVILKLYFVNQHNFFKIPYHEIRTWRGIDFYIYRRHLPQHHKQPDDGENRCQQVLQSAA